MSFTRESARRAAFICAAKHHRPFRDRLLEKIAMKRDGCWKWKGAHHADGYGRINLGYKKGNMLAHRAMWREHNGPIPEGLDVLHKCDNPACVNPDHLFLGTQRDNVRDMIKKGRNKYEIGELASNAKLTENQVRTIRQLASQGATNRKLGEMYGLTKSGIYCIVMRKAWKHVA